MKSIFYSMLIPALFSISACDSSSNNEGDLGLSDLSVSVLHEGQSLNDGSFTSKSSQSIRSQEKYESLLLSYSQDSPEVLSFSEGSLLLVDMGQKNTGGYRIEVESATENDTHVAVSVLLSGAGANCNVIQALTNPYQFVWITSDKELIINESVNTYTCG